MNQSVITADTLGIVIAKAEKVIGRELSFMEQALVEYAIEQIRLGVVEVA